METTNLPKTADSSLARDWLNFARYHLGGRRSLLILAAAIVGGGLALNWSWLVAAGIAPLLIAILPCAVMCVLGLCMHKKGGGSCSGGPSSKAGSDARGSGDGPGER